MARLTTTELAKRVGVSKSAVTQAKKKGRLKAEPDGTFDEDAPLTKYFIEEARDNKKNWNFDRGIVPKKSTTDAEYSTLDVFVTFADGKEYHVISHAFDSEDRELDPIIYPIPVPVRVQYLADVKVFTLEDDAELPTRIEVHGPALERTRRIHA